MGIELKSNWVWIEPIAYAWWLGVGLNGELRFVLIKLWWNQIFKWNSIILKQFRKLFEELRIIFSLLSLSRMISSHAREPSSPHTTSLPLHTLAISTQQHIFLLPLFIFFFPFFQPATATTSPLLPSSFQHHLSTRKLSYSHSSTLLPVFKQQASISSPSFAYASEHQQPLFLSSSKQHSD